MTFFTRCSIAPDLCVSSRERHVCIWLHSCLVHHFVSHSLFRPPSSSSSNSCTHMLLVLDFAFYAFVSTLFAISFFVRVIRLILESVNFDEYTAVSRPKLNCDRYGNKKVVMVVILLWVGIGAPDHQERWTWTRANADCVQIHDVCPRLWASHNHRIWWFECRGEQSVRQSYHKNMKITVEYDESKPQTAPPKIQRIIWCS